MEQPDRLPTLAELQASRASLLARLGSATDALNAASRDGAPSAMRYSLGARVRRLETMLAEVEAALGFNS